MRPCRGVVATLPTHLRFIPAVGRKHGPPARAVRRSPTGARCRVPDQGPGPGGRPRGMAADSTIPGEAQDAPPAIRREPSCRPRHRSCGPDRPDGTGRPSPTSKNSARLHTRRTLRQMPHRRSTKLLMMAAVWLLSFLVPLSARAQTREAASIPSGPLTLEQVLSLAEPRSEAVSNCGRGRAACRSRSDSRAKRIASRSCLPRPVTTARSRLNSTTSSTLEVRGPRVRPSRSTRRRPLMRASLKSSVPSIAAPLAAGSSVRALVGWRICPLVD